MNAVISESLPCTNPALGRCVVRRCCMLNKTKFTHNFPTLQLECAGEVLIDELGEDEEDAVNDESGLPSELCSALASGTGMPPTTGRTWNNRSQAVLQRWLDADCL